MYIIIFPPQVQDSKCPHGYVAKSVHNRCSCVKVSYTVATVHVDT